MAWGRVEETDKRSTETLNAQHSRGREKANTMASGAFALQIERATTEMLRQVPQSCGIPSYDGTQHDNLERAADCSRPGVSSYVPKGKGDGGDRTHRARLQQR